MCFRKDKCKSSTKKKEFDKAIAELKKRLKTIKLEDLLHDENEKMFADGCIVTITLEPTIEVEVMEVTNEKQ